MTIAFITNDGNLPALAGDDPDALLNYSFAVWVGSGVYKVPSADKRFAVLRAPFSYTLRTGQHDKPEFGDRLGFKLLLPAVVAAEEETDNDFTFGAAAFVPGLEVQIPVNAYWILKPFGQFGAGKDTAGGDLNYIYGGGVRSLVSFPWEKFVFGIGNSIILAEDRDSTKNESSGFSMLEAGLDVQRPLGLSFLDRDIDAGLFFVVSRFFNRVDFLEDGGDTERVNLIYTAGLTFGAKEPVSIWGIDFDRAGIDYRWGDEGFRGLGLNLGFPF
ncbi:hypothetical protein JY97_08760 [Alkalispirochaeta odontotermitis]|nr:hypothetical protein JY97_08760 [Alkalispirochaeta odontotermitis]CAB1083364.1 hypothetical protein D1AOALGA4SA_10935 [Olavius algarvensis Delta 1 endosymbiont]